MTTRKISVEALAMRNEARAKHAEQDALILQDDLIAAHSQIQQLTKELEHANAKLAKLETPADGSDT